MDEPKFQSPTADEAMKLAEDFMIFQLANCFGENTVLVDRFGKPFEKQGIFLWVRNLFPSMTPAQQDCLYELRISRLRGDKITNDELSHLMFESCATDSFTPVQREIFEKEFLRER